VEKGGGACWHSAPKGGSQGLNKRNDAVVKNSRPWGGRTLSLEEWKKELTPDPVSETEKKRGSLLQRRGDLFCLKKRKNGSELNRERNEEDSQSDLKKET